MPRTVLNPSIREETLETWRDCSDDAKTVMEGMKILHGYVDWYLDDRFGGVAERACPRCKISTCLAGKVDLDSTPGCYYILQGLSKHGYHSRILTSSVSSACTIFLLANSFL